MRPAEQEQRRPGRVVIGCILLIIVTGAIVYHNSFQGIFLFDDQNNIVANEKIRSLAWPWPFLENQRRPFLYLTLALNYYCGRYDPWGYHLVNLAVHIVSALLLFAIVRLTCLLPSRDRDVRGDALPLALLVSLIFLVHPLQTQSVTYVIQRSESLMGMFYLLTLYAAARYLRSGRGGWLALSTVAVWLGGLTKEVAVTAPVLVLLYDRTFVSPTFREAWGKHHKLYMALASAWLMMLFLFLTAFPEKVPTAGFHYKGITPLQYAWNQTAVILHYIRLVFWPSPLVLDYYWPPAGGVSEILPALGVIGFMLIFFLIAFWRSRAVGFLGAAFFILLLPSSSFIPVKDLAVEHRMYLPLICVVLLALLGLRAWLHAGRSPRRRQLFWGIGWVIILLLGILTVQRNQDYHDTIAMWQDVIHKRPENPRAYNNLGGELLVIGRGEEALMHFKKAIFLDPRYPDPYSNVGYYFVFNGRIQESITYFQKAIELDQNNAVAYNNLGAAYSDQGLYRESIPCFHRALELGFKDAGVYHNLGVALAQTGRPHEAIKNIQEALRLNPDMPDARQHLTEIQQKLDIWQDEQIDSGSR